MNARLSDADEVPGRAGFPTLRTGILVDLLSRGISCRFEAHGNSMQPFIRDGDAVVLTPIGRKPLRVGDVVAAVHRKTGRLLVHRVIGKRGREYLTKGDNAPAADGWFHERDIPGKVSMVTRSGKVVRSGLGREGLVVALFSRWNLLALPASLGRRILSRFRGAEV